MCIFLCHFNTAVLVISKKNVNKALDGKVGPSRPILFYN